MAKNDERTQGSKKAKPSAARGDNAAPKGQQLHPTHPVTVTLTADHDERDVISGYLDFLNRLAQDDAFRNRLVQDPDRVMTTYGVKFDPPLSTAFAAKKVALPPKDKVQELLDSLRRPAPSTLMGHFNLMFDIWTVITTGGRT